MPFWKRHSVLGFVKRPSRARSTGEAVLDHIEFDSASEDACAPVSQLCGVMGEFGNALLKGWHRNCEPLKCLTERNMHR
jgi:hypothetical protein